MSAEAYANADALEQQIGVWMAGNPGAAGFSESNKLVAADSVDPQMQKVLVELITHFGAHTRNAVAATLPKR